MTGEPLLVVDEAALPTEMLASAAAEVLISVEAPEISVDGGIALSSTELRLFARGLAGFAVVWQRKIEYQHIVNRT